MNTQPEALRLADAIKREWRDDALNYDTAQQAEAELRRLHEVNQELLKAVKECRNAIQGGQTFEPYDSRGAGYQQCFGIAFVEYLNAAITKANGGAA